MNLRVNRFARWVVSLAARPYRGGGAALAFAALVALAGSTACRPGFDPALYPNPEKLFQVGLQEYKARHWENAASAFEQLTKTLAARDPMLPQAYFYLGAAQERSGEHLLAAQSFSRLAESFSEDTLAPLAYLNAGRSYAKLWRRPELDPQYGERALQTLNSLLSLYPDSPLIPDAKAEIARLNDMLAAKDYGIGYHYLKRHAYDSAIIYFKDVIRLHPDTPSARSAYFRLHEIYRAIRYTEDARDVCDAMRKAYPNDREVVATCGSGSSAAASTPRT